MGEKQAGQKEAAEQAVYDLWLEYKFLLIESVTDGEVFKQWRVFSSEIDDYFTGGFAQPKPQSNHDEYNNWLTRGGHPKDITCTDAIAYWQAQVKGAQYPRLAHMALDLMTIAPMSSDPERIFSLPGLLLTSNHARLQSDIIGASMAMGSWDKKGVINIVDRHLSRL